MRITVATGPMLPVPPVRGGAIPKMWEGLAREFVRQGHSVCLFARSYPGQPTEEAIEGVRYRRWGGFDQGTSIALDLGRDLFYALGAAAKLPDADILVTNDFWLPVFARFRPYTGLIVINGNRYPKGQYFLYKHSARIAAASTVVADAIVRQTPAISDRVRVFPNPVDTEVFFPKDLKRSGDPRVLLYVGRLHPEKGVHLLAEAFRIITFRHPGWRLRIVGPWRTSEGGGGNTYAATLRTTLARVPADLVEPKFNAQSLADEYRAATLFCYPSLAEKGESFGLAALEAMACEVPPVVSGLDCFRDFVTDGETGWSFDHRANDPIVQLSRVLERAMENPEQICEFGRRASVAAQRFGYADVANRYLQDFETLLTTHDT